MTDKHDNPRDAILALMDNHGVWMGQETVRQTIATRMVTGGLTVADVVVLGEYFDKLSERMDDPGGVIATRLSHKSDWQDLVRQAKRKAAHAGKRQTKRDAKGRTNQHAPVSAADMAEQAADADRVELARRLAYHVLDVGWTDEKAAEYDGCTAADVAALVALTQSDDAENCRWRYIRQERRSMHLRYPQWRDGKQPLPPLGDADDNDPRKQPGASVVGEQPEPNPWDNL